MSKGTTYDAGSISVLEGLEAVRKRPGMYIGSVSRKGLNHLIYEIVDNSVDEHLAGFCDHIEVFLEKDGSATVIDNGRGIPVDMHEKGVSAERLVFTTLHAGGKFDDSVYKTSGGLHGVGSSVVNALSRYLDIEVSRDGWVHHDRYERGIPTLELENGLLPRLRRTKETGTKINFLPDDEIFEKVRFKADEVKSRLHETAYLNPKLTIVFEDRRMEEPERIVYHEPDGIIGFVKDLNKNKEVLHDVIYFTGTSDGITVEAAVQYVNEFHENVLGFCNNIYNAEAAALAALAAGVSPSVVEDTLYAFTGVEHRMEPAGTVGGVEYINDSKATNVDSAWYALDSMTRPTVWIVGGTDKGNDYDVLKPLAERHVKALVCMGVDNAKLIRDFTGIVPVIYDTHSLDEAMRVCTEAAEPGDTVLLSPACASFDLFRNYEERGRLFKAAVERLKENAG